MDIHSKEHQQLIINSILRVSIRTMTWGLIIGLILIAPSFLRENSFSLGLAAVGQTIIIASIVYALWIALKKYRMIQNARQSE